MRRVALSVCALAALTPVASVQSATPRFCLAREVTARAVFQGATGAAEGGIYATNASKTRCALVEHPFVSLVVGRKPLAVRPFPGATTTGRRRVIPIVVAPGKRAFIHLRWSNWCGRRYARVGLRLWVTSVEPPIRVAGTATPPRCDDRKTFSSLAVGPFQLVKR